MFGTFIKFVAETAGQIVGEVAHQTSEVASAIASIPEEFSKGYDKELFHAKPETPSSSETSVDPE